MTSEPNPSSHEQSEQELEDKEEESGNEGDREDHVYQLLGGREECLEAEAVYALPHKPKVRHCVM